ncbi:deoxyribonuclease gamma-like [Heptranchias perlo]|uniref:deoxyribonuclease gamma-like n=1 Tax=Heptranchias perlo TaxID=212740 RepID=UPI003559B395
MRRAFLLWVLAACQGTAAFRICSFNIQCFGEAKATNQRAMGVLVKIVTRCDICLVMEVRDAKGEAVALLIKELNRFDRSHRYSYVASERLGRGSYKEQYVFIHRSDTVKITHVHQYKDNQADDPDAFAREPLIVRFSSQTTAIKDFVLVSQHTCPKDAAREIDELYDVFQEIRKHWDMESVMFLGDLNAGCSYVPAKAWRTIRLRKKPGFHWLIGDHEDTTVRQKTHCAYDRIVVHGSEFYKAIVPGSAKPFNFREKFKLTEEEALEVSDHFPVEVQIKLDGAVRNEL